MAIAIRVSQTSVALLEMWEESTAGLPACLFPKHGFVLEAFLDNGIVIGEATSTLVSSCIMPIGTGMDPRTGNNNESGAEVDVHASWSLLRPLFPQRPRGRQSSEEANQGADQGLTQASRWALFRHQS